MRIIIFFILAIKYLSNTFTVHPVDFSGKVGSGQTLVAETKQAIALSNLSVEDKRIKRYV